MTVHAVLPGDCLGPGGMRLLRDLSVDHAITDPPYTPHTHNKHRIGQTGGNGRTDLPGGHVRPAELSRRKELGFDPIDNDLRARVATELARTVRRWVLVFTDDLGLQDWINALEAVGLQFVRSLVWIKIGCAPQFTGDRPANGYELIVVAHQTKPDGSPMRKRWNAGGKRGVYAHPIVLDRSKTGERVHTTQKPEALLEEFVRDFTDPSEVILDPFLGSGTTLVAARRFNRSGIGWELQPEYVETTRRRIADVIPDRRLTYSRSAALQQELAIA